MAKNIILCADGTGNKGGYTPDSNVFKMYQAIDIHHPQKKQLVFYDNGVGTQSNKYLRALSGAVGLGFKANVCDLYEFLCRHYDPGDQIYLFGYSRGAATIRACNGFVAACGLVDGRDEGNSQLKAAVKTAMRAYARPNKRGELLAGLKRHPGIPSIEFIGVWDTVAALGFPERTDVVTLGLWVIHKIFYWAGVAADKFAPHKFYNYEITPNVKTARQALSIDDARTSFWPLLWREKAEDAGQTDILQVWFAGSHGNVGGGYARAGLTYVTFAWMLQQVGELPLKKDTRESAQASAHPHGRLYDARMGLGIYYRYHPRAIQSLCHAAGAPIYIHESVMERYEQRTANYSPLLLPKAFQVIDNQGAKKSGPPVYAQHWDFFHKKIQKFIGVRKVLYGLQLELTLAVVAVSIYAWSQAGHPETVHTLPDFQKGLISFLEGVTPEFLHNLVRASVSTHYIYSLAGLAFILFLFISSRYAKAICQEYAERVRKLYIIAPQPHPEFPTESENQAGKLVQAETIAKKTPQPS